MNARLGTTLGASAIAVGAVVLDVVTKAWAQQELVLHEPVAVLGQFGRLRLGYNTGTAFGLFVDSGPLVPIVTGVIIGAMLVWLATTIHRGNRLDPQLLAVALVLGGAIGNFVDRLPDGRVTDFLDVGVGALRWPSFNLADASIVAGVAAIVLLGLFGGRPAAEG